uniref:IS30 family transposase n=1 Tax=Nocardiopsis kunsanensis TaxID=141693 RepID=UPI000376B0DC|nr:IS30 family transposase [Nocardiopsis kunsanensis]
MRSTREHPDQAEGHRVPGHWEGDLLVGKEGKSAVITLVDRQSRFTMILALPQGKSADHVADVLIDHVQGLPALVRKSLTWDQGTEMGRHAAVATDLPVFFVDPHSPWQRPTNENTNHMIREYLPKGTDIVQHQPYPTAIAEELNTRPRACLGFYTPQEVFHRMLLGDGTGDDSESVASTN